MGVYWKIVISGNRQQKVVPYLLFSESHLLEEAVNFYCSLFQETNSEVHSFENHHQTESTEFYFRLQNQQFIAAYINETFPTFTEGISFIIVCNKQKEVDAFWNALSKEGKGLYREASAWLVDKYRLWWQIISLELTTVVEKGSGIGQAIEEMGSNLLIDVKKNKKKRLN